MDFHPLANEFPLMNDEELSFLIADMKANGFDADQPITTYDGFVLDGRDRYRASFLAEVEPVFKEFQGTEKEAAAFVRRRNEDRKHMADLVAKRRKARVAESRRGGKSLRAIAEEEEISLAQVRRDIEDTGVPGGGTPEPKNGKVTGRDGKQQSAKKRTPKKPEPRAEVLDQTGRAVPDGRCRDAFASLDLPNLIESLKQTEAMFSAERWVSKAVKLMDHYPYLLGTKVKEHAWEALRELQLAIEALEAGLPYAVCPKCEGTGGETGKPCRGCRGCGHVPETRYKELVA